MTRVITKAISDTERSTRLWMVLAFIAGIVFTAVLAQTLVAANTVFPASSGDHDSLTPGTIPDDGYLVKRNIYGLVYACPGREAMLSG
jgi:hypothetical protein